MSSRSSPPYSYPTPNTTPVKNDQWGQPEQQVKCRGCGRYFTTDEWNRHANECAIIRQMTGRAPFMRTSDHHTSAGHVSSSSGSYPNQQYLSSAHHGQPHYGHPAQYQQPITPPKRGTAIPVHQYPGHSSGIPINHQPHYSYHQNPTPPHTPPGNTATFSTFQVDQYTPASTSGGKPRANRKRGLDDIKMYDGASQQFFNQ